MSAKIDYSVYNEQALFSELDNTKAQLARLESEKENLLDKKSQIEQALHSIPTEETAFDLKNAKSLPQYTNHEQLIKELQAEIEAEKCGQ